MRYEAYCDGCGYWVGFRDTDENPQCPRCKTGAWLMDNEPNRSRGYAEAYAPLEDGWHSDADGGL